MPTINAKQLHLQDYWKSGQMQATATPLLNVLTSEANSQRLAQEVQVNSDNNGKIAAVVAYFRPQLCEVAPSATNGLVCDASAPSASISKTYTPSFAHFSHAFKYNPKAYETDIDGGLRYYNQEVARGLDKMRRSAEMYLITQMYSLKGAFAKSVIDRSTIAADVKEIGLFSSATIETLSRFPLGEMRRDSQANKYMNAPTIIGSGHVQRYMESLGEAGLDMYGFDAQKALSANRFNFIPTVYADQLGTIATAEEFIMYDMGAMPIVNPAIAVGDAIWDTADKKAYSFTDPVSGALIDVKENVTCVANGTFETTVSLNLRLMPIAAPNNLYCDDEDIVSSAAGVNGINAYKVVNPA